MAKMNEMTRSCQTCARDYTVAAGEADLISRVSPRFGERAEEIPLPTRCPACRKQRRMAWRNERALYRRKCTATGAPMISYFPENSPFPVYEIDYWFSDKWDVANYSLDYDFSKTFNENILALQKIAPRYSIQQQKERMVNSQFCNCASNCENCYLLFDSDFCRDSYYSNVLKKSVNCIDCSFTTGSELCYQTVNCSNCYNLKFSFNCINCSDSYFLDDCIGCSSCAFSTNLRNKRFYFRNRQLTESEYAQATSAMCGGSRKAISKLRDEFADYLRTQPRRDVHGYQNENTFGDYISRSKNAVNCFNVEDCWDVYNCDFLYRAKNCADVTSFGEGIELIYETTTAGLNSYNCAFGFTTVMGSNNVYYSDTAYASQNCFGCISVRRKEYCILNRQYSPSDYRRTVSKIIGQMREAGEWGEYFPGSSSPFGYDETVAQDYFPLTKDEALAQGYRWADHVSGQKHSGGGSPAELLSEAGADVTGRIFSCVQCSKDFKIIAQENEFYKKGSLPLPDSCPNCRHIERIWLQNPRELFPRSCGCCGKGISTTFAPQRPEKVLCEPCYLKAAD